MAGKVLLKGGCVLTLGTRTPNFTEADVLVEDGVIAEVGPGIRARDAQVVDCADTIVMPGFVDTHRHVWRSLFRNAGASEHGSLDGLAALHRPDDVYAATLAGLLGALEAGITTVVDWSDLSVEDDTAEAALQAHADAGLRTVLVQPARPTGRDVAADWAALSARVEGDRLRTVAAGLPDLDDRDVDRAVADWSRARDAGVRIHAHAAGPSAGGSAARLASRGLLGSDVTVVHAAGLDGTDLDAVASAGAGVVLTPASEMANGLGAPPVQQLIDRGIRPGLGVDVEHLAPGDMFAQMRAVQSIQHATLFDLKLAGKAGIPTLLNTRDVIRYGTVDGARAVGLATTTGALEPGRQADVIVLRTDRPNIFPVNDPIGAVVWGMDTSNLDWVLVGGRVMMRGGAVEADVEAARRLANEARQRVAAAAGLMADAGTAT